MSKLHQKAEITANVLIIVVAVLLIGVIFQKSFFSKSAAKIQPVVGSHVDIPGEKAEGNPRTLIMALQTGCHFCNESAPFYKRLIDSVKGKNIKLVAVLPTAVDESRAHLNELGLEGIEVLRSPLEKIQVSGTPTLILTNEKGEVTDYWVGKLSPDKETEVINKLDSQEERSNERDNNL